MSQVIRKYAGGGSTSTSDVAPLEISGQYYDPEAFRREVLGDKASSYARAMGFDSKRTNQFMADLKDHIDQMLTGTMWLTDEGTLVNTTGDWSNESRYIKERGPLGRRRKLSEKDLKNNRSMDVTTYLINGLRDGAFYNSYYNSPKEYSLNFDNLFQTKFHPGIDFSTYIKDWDSLDESDKNTGKRGITNRLKSIGNLLLEEADKLDNNPDYRRQFSWNGWEDNWEGRQKSFTTKLRDAAKRLSDGEYSDDDKRYLASIGVNLNKYLSTTDEEAARRIKEESERKKQEEEAAATKQKNDNITKYGNAFQSALPWQTNTPILWWDGTSYKYNSPEYNNLYNNNAEVRKYVDDVYNSALSTKIDSNMYNYDEYRLPSVLNGYDYAVDISDYFPILNDSKSYVIRKDPMDPSTAAVYIRGKRYYIYKSEDNKYYAAPLGWKGPAIELGTINPNAEARPLSGVPYNPSFFENLDLNNTAHLAAYFNQPFGHKSMKDHFSDAQLLYDWYRKGKGTAIGSDGRKAIRVEKTDRGYELILDVSGYGAIRYLLKSYPGNRRLKYSDLVNTYKEMYKDGGVLKAQAGVKLGTTVPSTITPTKQPAKIDNPPSKLYASFSSKENARNQFLTQSTLTNTDKIRLGSAITDLTSAVAGFIPGLNIASTVTGAASSFTDFGADMTDLANDRKGVSFWDSLGNLGLNLGMDLVSLIPGLKSFKATSALKRIASFVPHIAGIIQTSNLITDENLRKSLSGTLTKIKDLDISRLNTQDFRNLAYIGRTILGLKGAYGQVKNRRSQATGDVEVKGTVKVNGETKRITATIPKDEIKTFSKNNKVAREALAEVANKKFGKPKTDTDEGLSFSDKDITLSTGNFGRAKTTKVRETVNNEYAPRRAFEGWFGSKGKNWWFSDHGLSRSNNFWARQYGFETPAERRKRIIAERDNIRREILENARVIIRPSDNYEILTKYKLGGTLIPKFQDSGKINYLNYDNPYIDPTTFFTVNGISSDQSFSGFKGKYNHRTWNRGKPTLNYPASWYSDKHQSVSDLTTLDVINERDNYYKSDNSSHIWGDVQNAYNNWTKSNTNGTLDDFLNYYNTSISTLRQWATDKSKQPYGTTGQADNNRLFHSIYNNYTVGYDPKQDDILGGGTYRRVPNQFNSIDDYKQYRQGKVGNFEDNIWMDNAGYLHVGEYGEPEKASSDELDKSSEAIASEGYGKIKDKSVGGWKVDPSSMLGLTEVIAGLTANTQATKKLMEFKPTLKQAPWINRYIFGNYPALARAAQSAGDLNTQASVPISSDAALAYLARQEANAKGRQLIDSGNQQNFETYWKSRENVQQGNEINETNAVNTANENTAAANAMRNAKLKWKADLITSNVAGNIKPWLSEQRSYINQNNMMRRNAELNYGTQLANLQVQESQDRLIRSYVAKAKSSGIDAAEKTDDEILNEYFNNNPGAEEEFNKKLRTLQQNIFRRQLGLYTDLGKIPVGFGLTYQPKKTYRYDITLGDYVEVAKKGGSLTISDRIKLQKLKDFNKKMLSDSKESIKSIRENQREFGRMYRSMSAGTLALIKRAMQ